MDEKDIRRRRELVPRTRAVSDALDEYLIRVHGIFTSWAHPLDFMDWLEKRGYIIISEKEST